ncbi:hypothetical protein [Pantoea ananatis]|nr:hypothetical protein [Pantoea ananatis]
MLVAVLCVANSGCAFKRINDVDRSASATGDLASSLLKQATENRPVVQFSNSQFVNPVPLPVAKYDAPPEIVNCHIPYLTKSPQDIWQFSQDIATNCHLRNRVHLREQKKVTAQEVQALKEGETISLFNGKLVRGNSLYIKDADKLTSEKLRINRFMEVSAPSDAALLATAPYRQRRSFVRAEKVKHILKVLNAAPDRKDTSGLVLTDPALAAACRFDLECSLLWQRPPSAAVRTSILWNMVLSSLPKRGRGYLVRLRVPQLIQVAPDAIERAKQHYVPLSSEEDFQDDFSYRY